MGDLSQYLIVLLKVLCAVHAVYSVNFLYSLIYLICMVSIRKANPEDIDVIVDMWVEFMGNHDEIVLKENPELKSFIVRKENAPENYREFAQKHMKAEDGEVFIAEADGDIAGFALVFVKDEIPVFEIEKIGYISDLFVKEKFRGMKVGSKLMEESIKWLKEKGLEYVSIGMYPDNKLAHSFYEKWGFFDYHVDMRKKI